MSSDYSQQEPSCLATFCKEMGYDSLFKSRFNGNDLYSEVAGACFDLPYEMCCEFDKDHHKNPPEYKERRNLAKPVLLGILYGRSDESVAEGMGITLEEAKRLKANLYKRFTEILKFEESSLAMAKELGYVTTVCGRKRRLPDLQLPEYSFKWEDGFEPVGDILDFDELEIDVPYTKQKFYTAKLKNARGWKSRDKIIESAKKEHIEIISNRSRISEATRQCVNARVQGSAADLTKLAMIELYNNERLKELGFRILIPVHDEIIAECPEKNAKECSRLLTEVMSHAAEEILHMPFSCDCEISKAWYGKEYEFIYDDEEDDDE